MTALSSRRAPVGLDAGAIVAAALELLDQFGVDGFSMRRLCRHLGVTEPTVYWHVGNKAELWSAVVDHVLADQVLVLDRQQSWEERLRSFFSTSRQMLMAHPCILELMRYSLPKAVENWADQVLQIMLDAGFSEADAASYARLTIWQSIGFARMEADLITRSPVSEAVEKRGGLTYRIRPEFMPDDPTQAQILMATVDLDDQHDAMVEVFVAGVKKNLENPAGSPGHKQPRSRMRAPRPQTPKKG